ncbi:MAG: hypothetical protein MUE56_02345 [Ignavibacteria bacterium]|jgi:hypothetical protein|nr:hypothetical protein [Ignavibacteria bacterium]
MNIYLNKEETDYILDMLDKDLAETKTEIHHSGNHTYKEELKEKVKFVQLLISKVTLLGPDGKKPEN